MSANGSREYLNNDVGTSVIIGRDHTDIIMITNVVFTLVILVALFFMGIEVEIEVCTKVT